MNIDTLREQLVPETLPRHVAIIMDGNGRWAQRRHLPRRSGHFAGVRTVRNIIEETIAVNIPYLTLYAFSTENWKRPPREIVSLFSLFYLELRRQLSLLTLHDIRVRVLGSFADVPGKLRKRLEEVVKKTAHNTRLTLNIAFNYGGRQEIVLAMKEIGKKLLSNELSLDDFDQNLISQYIMTAGQPDPDLIIRTSGENRLSNFLIWQAAYSEIEITNTLWPDFTREDYIKTLLNYQNRERRFGGLK